MTLRSLHRLATLLLAPCLLSDSLTAFTLSRPEAAASNCSSIAEQAVVEPLVNILSSESGRKDDIYRMLTGQAEPPPEVPAAAAPMKMRGGNDLPPRDPSRDEILEMLVTGNVGGAEGTLEHLFLGLSQRNRFKKMREYGVALGGIRSFAPGNVIVSWAGNGPPRVGWLQKIEGTKITVSPRSDGSGPLTVWDYSEKSRRYFQLCTSDEMQTLRLGQIGYRFMALLSEQGKDWKTASDSRGLLHKSHPAGAEAKLEKSGNWILSVNGFPSAGSQPALTVQRLRMTKTVRITLAGARNAIPFDLPEEALTFMIMRGDKILEIEFHLRQDDWQRLHARGLPAEGTSWDQKVRWKFHADAPALGMLPTGTLAGKLDKLVENIRVARLEGRTQDAAASVETLKHLTTARVAKDKAEIDLFDPLVEAIWAALISVSPAILRLNPQDFLEAIKADPTLRRAIRKNLKRFQDAHTGQYGRDVVGGSRLADFIAGDLVLQEGERLWEERGAEQDASLAEGHADIADEMLLAARMAIQGYRREDFAKQQVMEDVKAAIGRGETNAHRESNKFQQSKRGWMAMLPEGAPQQPSEPALRVVRLNPYGPSTPKIDASLRMIPVDAEVSVPQELRDKVRAYAFPLQEFLRENFLHPVRGYYAGNGVEFHVHYATQVNDLRPFYGGLVARLLYTLWRGMRRNPNADAALGAHEPFWILELAVGLGHLGQSILSYIQAQAAAERAHFERNHAPLPPFGWAEFDRQLRYVMNDVAAKKEGSVEERAENQDWIKAKKLRVDRRDALEFLRSQRTPLKGVVLSHEFFDNLTPEQIRMHHDGRVEVGCYVPVIASNAVAALQKQGLLPRELEALSIVGMEGVAIPKKDFLTLLDRLEEPANHEAKGAFAGTVQMALIFEDAARFPAVLHYLDVHKVEIAEALAVSEGCIEMLAWGVMRDYIDALAAVIDKGYHIAIDYFRTIRSLLRPNAPQARFFFDTAKPLHWQSGWGTFDVTFWPDVTFLERYGAIKGFRTIYSGPQAFLEAGAPWSMSSTEVGHALRRNGIVDHLRSSRLSNPELQRKIRLGLPAGIGSIEELGALLMDDPVRFEKLILESVALDPGRAIFILELAQFVHYIAEKLELGAEQLDMEFYNPGMHLLIQQKMGTDDRLGPIAHPLQGQEFFGILSDEHEDAQEAPVDPSGQIRAWMAPAMDRLMHEHVRSLLPQEGIILDAGDSRMLGAMGLGLPENLHWIYIRPSAEDLTRWGQSPEMGYPVRLPDLKGIENGSVDVVSDTTLFHLMPEYRRPAYLAGVRRVLAPGGHLVHALPTLPDFMPVAQEAAARGLIAIPYPAPAPEGRQGLDYRIAYVNRRMFESVSPILAGLDEFSAVTAQALRQYAENPAAFGGELMALNPEALLDMKELAEGFNLTEGDNPLLAELELTRLKKAVAASGLEIDPRSGFVSQEVMVDRPEGLDERFNVLVTNNGYFTNFHDAELAASDPKKVKIHLTLPLLIATKKSSDAPPLLPTRLPAEDMTAQTIAALGPDSARLVDTVLVGGWIAAAEASAGALLAQLHEFVRHQSYAQFIAMDPNAAIGILWNFLMTRKPAEPPRAGKESA